MPSPFPGMNPYLERSGLWPDVHNSLISTLRARLTQSLRPRYFVSLERTVYIHELPDEPAWRLGRPDLSILPSDTPSAAAGARTLPAPARGRFRFPVDEEKISYLAITDPSDRRVVTVIEILSPTNKARGPDREQYIAKRHGYLRSPASFVEIDLLRTGPRMPAESFPECVYSVMVSRPELRPEVEVWPVQLRERLPVIPIPLENDEEEPQIDLQDILNQVYDEAAFELVAYDNPPEPPLSPEDAAWAEAILAQQPQS